jgi:uncharacterized LabA/DUF88 family protein
MPGHDHATKGRKYPAMVESPIPVPSDPHLRRWMMFVDGENLAIRAAKIAPGKFALTPGEYYQPNVFVWMPKIKPSTNWIGDHAPLQYHATRAHYYTSVQGTDEMVSNAREAIWKIGFTPLVGKKTKDGRAKAVDIALTTDLLSHAFLDNYDVAVLVTGDGDYIRAVEAVKNQGKIVYVVFFQGTNDAGLNPELRLTADTFFDLGPAFEHQWKQHGSGTPPPPESGPFFTSARSDFTR